jgi:hypothetical protein
MEKKAMWSMMKLLEYQQGGTDSEWYQEPSTLLPRSPGELHTKMGVEPFFPSPHPIPPSYPPFVDLPCGAT